MLDFIHVLWTAVNANVVIQAIYDQRRNSNKLGDLFYFFVLLMHDHVKMQEKNSGRKENEIRSENKITKEE